MKAAFLAGAAYFTALFGAGTAFGVVRVFYVAPHFSSLTALLLELPLILAVAYVVSSWIADYLQVGPQRGYRMAMGGTAFALLIVAEIGIPLVLSAGPSTPGSTLVAGLGFAAQALACAFPLIRRDLRAPSADR